MIYQIFEERKEGYKPSLLHLKNTHSRCCRILARCEPQHCLCAVVALYERHRQAGEPLHEHRAWSTVDRGLAGKPTMTTRRRSSTCMRHWRFSRTLRSAPRPIHGWAQPLVAGNVRSHRHDKQSPICNFSTSRGSKKGSDAFEGSYRVTFSAWTRIFTVVLQVGALFGIC